MLALACYVQGEYDYFLPKNKTKLIGRIDLKKQETKKTY